MKTHAHHRSVVSKFRASEARIEILERRIAPATVVNFTGTGSIVVDLAAHTITDSTQPGSPVTFGVVDIINITTGTALTIKGTAGSDEFTYTPTGATAGTADYVTGHLAINFTGITGAFTIDPLGGNDLITVAGSPGNDAITAAGGATPTVQLGATKALTLVAANTAALSINTLGGSDTLTVDSTAGSFPVPITYHGGDGFDTLVLKGTGATSSSYTLGPTPDAGVSTIVTSGITQTVTFAEIEPVQDSVSATTLTVNGTNANNSINYTQGPGGGIFTGNTGLISVDGNETIEFNNKTNVVINALSGDDTINVNNATTPAGLTGAITVNGGDPTANDTLIVNGRASTADTITYTPNTSDSGSVAITGLPTVNFATTENLVINGQNNGPGGTGDALTINTSNLSSNETETLTPGSTFDSGHVDFRDRPGGVNPLGTPVSFLGLGVGGSLAFTDVGRFNRLVYNGTDLNDTFSVSAAGQVVLNTQIPVSTASITNLTLAGLDGDDVFTISGGHNLPGITVQGGNSSAADVVNFQGTGGAVTMDFAAGTVTQSGSGGVALSGVEKVNIDAAGGSLKVSGTAGDDSFAYTPTGASAGTVTLAGANPLLTFTNVGSPFTIDPLGGNDVITVNGGSANDTITATAGATPTVQVGSTMTLTLAAANTESLVIEGFDGNDTLTVDSTAGAFAIPITYHGGNGADTLALKGTADSSSYTLGPTADAGVSTLVIGAATQTVAFTGIEPIQDSVTATTITVNGTNANNAINYTQGAGGGSFVGNTGLISVDGFETIEFNNKTNVVINGLAGDDVINLAYDNTANPAGLTGTITVNGGNPSGSDTLIINGLSGALDNLRYVATSVASGTVINDSEPQPNVLFTGMERLTVTLQQTDGDGVRVDGTMGNDAIEFFQGVTSDSGTFVGTMDQNNATGVGPFTMTPLTYIGAFPLANDSDVNFFNPGGTDSVVFNGTVNDDIISIGGGQAGGTEFRNTLNGITMSLLEVFNVSSATVRGLQGNDTFNVAVPAGPAGVALHIEGGGSSASADVLNYTSPSGAASTIDFASSTITSTGGNAVTFSGVGRINEISSGAGSQLTINGTSGDDSFTYTPTGTTAGTVTLVGTNPLVTFTGVDGAVTIDPLGGNDTVTVNGSSANDAITATAGAVPTVQVGSFKSLSLAAGTTESLLIEGLEGNDTLTVDSTAGAFAVPIAYHGGNGFDTLVLQGTATSSSYTLGPTADAGVSTLVIGAVTQTVAFSGIEPIQDSVVADTITVNATNGNNSINYTAGPAGGIFTGSTGLVTVDAFETIEFNNKSTLIINGQLGDDSINLNNPATPAGLTGITVNGGGSGGNDVVTLFGTAAADDFTFVGTDAESGMLMLVGSVPVTFAGTKRAILDGQAGDDSFLVASSVGRVELKGGDGADTVDFTGSASAITFNLDSLGLDQHVNATGEIVSLVDVIENFTGSAFNDVIFAKVQSFNRSIDGGAPSTVPGVPGAPIPPGDRLTVDGQGQFATLAKVSNAGTVNTSGYGTISFFDVETVKVINSSASGGFTGDGSGAFAASVLYKVGGNPVQTVVGDVNGDGFDDIVTANRNTHSVSVLLSNGDGTFAPVTTYKLGTIAPIAIALGNVDDNLNVPGGDNALDIVLVQNGAAKVSVMLNDGTGNFGTPTTFRTVAAAPGKVKLADVNNDGLLDIVSLHKLSGNVSVLLNTGGGVAGTASFGTASIFKTRAIASDLAIANFDGDIGGNLDIAVVGTGGFLRVLTGDGTGAFTLQTTKYDIGKNPSVIAIADFNNDGKLDIAVNHTVQHFVSVLAGRGNLGGDLFEPGLQTSFAFVDFHTARSMTAADFDGDGNVDLAFSSDSNNILHIGLGLGTGLFKRPLNLLVTAPVIGPTVGTTGLVTGDFNGDGALDIVTSNNGSNKISIVFRTPTV